MKKFAHMLMLTMLALAIGAATAMAIDHSAGHGAGNGMDGTSMEHGSMSGNSMSDGTMTHDSMANGWSMMQDGLAAMKKGREMALTPTTLDNGLAIMKKQMMPMHDGMMLYEKAKGDGAAEHMQSVNKGMMQMMKGMAQVKKDHVGGMKMINAGIDLMDKGMAQMHHMAD